MVCDIVRWIIPSSLGLRLWAQSDCPALVALYGIVRASPTQAPTNGRRSFPPAKHTHHLLRNARFVGCFICHGSLFHSCWSHLGYYLVLADYRVESTLQLAPSRCNRIRYIRSQELLHSGLVRPLATHTPRLFRGIQNRIESIARGKTKQPLTNHQACRLQWLRICGGGQGDIQPASQPLES